MGTILLAGTDPTAIAGHRSAFNAQVQADVSTLQSTLTDLLGLFPNATKSATASVRSTLTTGTGSLLDQLNALTTPTDLSGTTSQSFTSQATSIISTTQKDVLGQIRAAI